MREFLADKQTTMTAVADLLVARYGVAFRAAHDSVSRMVNQYPEIPPAGKMGPILERIVAEVANLALHLDEAELAMALDPVHTALAANYGGGPGPAAVRSQARSTVRRTGAIERRLKARRKNLRDAQQKLRAAADEIIAQNLNGAGKP